ncbi:hypothetical protein EXS73_02070 [Candidatus Pacearchaeota archaeon]|nr:hypothetical protein [Candidatus Pacearchaeota archaeon]
MRYVSLLALTGILGCTSGCVTRSEQWKRPVTAYIDRMQSPERIVWQERAGAHPLYDLIPRHREQIPVWALGTWGTWALVGNDEDGIFGERGGYTAPPSFLSAGSWALRNPFHNVTFHVIGSADKTNHTAFTLLSLGMDRVSVCTPYTTQYASGAGLNVQLHDAKPFVSFYMPLWKRREFQLYAGWRERGNFGLAFRPWQKRETLKATAGD